MGLTIHYSGKLKNKDLLPSLIEEAEDVAIAQNWEYHIFETEFPDDTFGKKEFNGEVYGIILNPPECESVCLTFLSNGKLCTPAMLMFYLESKEKNLERLITGVHTKTQYAGFEVHRIIIDFFKHLAPRYLKNFKVMDESDYWETGEVKVLKENFGEYDELIENFSFALENFPMKEGENFGDYLKRTLGDAAGKLKKRPRNKNK